MSAQEIRDDALSLLLETREAERAASAAHREASAAWLQVICKADGWIERPGGRRGLLMCCEAPGHDGEHRNLLGDSWPRD